MALNGRYIPGYGVSVWSLSAELKSLWMLNLRVILLQEWRTELKTRWSRWLGRFFLNHFCEVTPAVLPVFPACRPSRTQATSLFRRRPGTPSAPWWQNWSGSMSFPSDWVSMAVTRLLQTEKAQLGRAARILYMFYCTGNSTIRMTLIITSDGLELILSCQHWWCSTHSQTYAIMSSQTSMQHPDLAARQPLLRKLWCMLAQYREWAMERVERETYELPLLLCLPIILRSHRRRVLSLP